MATDLPPLNPLPFEQAIEHFRGKLNLPTEKWTDLDKGMHSRAFVVAGAQKAELLAGFRQSIDSALAKGTTFQDFRKDFNRLVKQHGWSHNGTPGWRSRVIYETNIRTAYQAGRYKQMTDPEVLSDRPFWEYFHGNSAVPRPNHLSWDGKVLRHDDPWWDIHYPPNGWGCSCTVHSVSQDDLDREDKTPWEDPPEGGVPDEWAYNVGESAWGKPMADRAVRDSKAKWSPIEGWSQATPKPEQPIPTVRALASRLRFPRNAEDAKSLMREFLGAKEEVVKVGTGDWQFPVVVDVDSLAEHFYQGPNPDPNRTCFFPYAMQTLRNPGEAWMAFWRKEQTGEVALRVHALSIIQEEGKAKAIAMAANVHQGVLTGWTLIPSSDVHWVEHLRIGRLLMEAK